MREKLLDLMVIQGKPDGILTIYYPHGIDAAWLFTAQEIAGKAALAINEPVQLAWGAHTEMRYQLFIAKEGEVYRSDAFTSSKVLDDEELRRDFFLSGASREPPLLLLHVGVGSDTSKYQERIQDLYQRMMRGDAVRVNRPTIYALGNEGVLFTAPEKAGVPVDEPTRQGIREFYGVMDKVKLQAA